MMYVVSGRMETLAFFLHARLSTAAAAVHSHLVLHLKRTTMQRNVGQQVSSPLLLLSPNMISYNKELYVVPVLW